MYYYTYAQSDDPAVTQDSKPGEIDLHGLFVKEAIEHTDRALEEAKQRGDSQLHLIVGAWIKRHCS
jgi:hypothetical protein